MRSARKQSEKKTLVTSVRMSEEQHKQIEKNAKKHKMTVSNYMITQAVNGEKGLDPKMMVEIPNLMNMAYSLAKKYEPETYNTMRERTNGLWQGLV